MLFSIIDYIKELLEGNICAAKFVNLKGSDLRAVTVSVNNCKENSDILCLFIFPVLRNCNACSLTIVR